MTQRILFVFGTRPEAIKMAPLILEFKNHPEFHFSVCITAQHREMLDQVIDFFDISIDYDLDLMQPNQSLFDITANGLKKLESVLSDYNPDLIFVQGDTTTAFIGALAGYYMKIKVVHIEAGLRSHNKFSPFPEEINRILAGHLADFHFTPTIKAQQNLNNEGIFDNIYTVGNTVIDALFKTLELISFKNLERSIISDINIPNFDFDSYKIILVTSHRRESFGKPFEDICNSIKELAQKFMDIDFIYPVHLNPNVRQTVSKILTGIKNIHLIDPLPYPHLIWLLSKSFFVMTDSGGIQEEAPSLGKPVLVMREVTERIEGIQAGTAKLVGSDKNEIIKAVTLLLTNKNEYDKMAKAINPYGDGKSSKRIFGHMKKLFNNLVT